MSRLKLKYVQAFVNRETGRPFYYFRRRGYPRVRLPGLAGSAEFMQVYQDAAMAARINRLLSFNLKEYFPADIKPAPA